MSALDTLSELFSKFPGVGPRQARRFGYFLLTQNAEFRKSLSATLARLGDDMKECPSCHRFSQTTRTGNDVCDICVSDNTDHATLLIVEKDADFESIRRAGIYHGRYFILGGTVPILEENPSQKIRARALFDEVQTKAKDGALKEIVLATGATAEGDNTRAYVQKILEPLVKKYSLTLSSLGRGLSTGTELEYSDTDTFQNAFKNRR